MADQNKPYEQIPTETPSSPSPIETFTSPPPPTPPPSSSPTVIIPPRTESIPKWFYVLFGTTIIVFCAVTTLLVLTLRQKETGSLKISPSPFPTPSPSPSPFPTVTLPVEEITPSVIPTEEATEAALLN